MAWAAGARRSAALTETHVRILGYPMNPRYAWALSNRGRNRVALVRIDLRNGREDLLGEHPVADLYGGVSSKAAR